MARLPRPRGSRDQVTPLGCDLLSDLRSPARLRRGDSRTQDLAPRTAARSCARRLTSEGFSGVKGASPRDRDRPVTVSPAERSGHGGAPGSPGHCTRSRGRLEAAQGRPPPARVLLEQARRVKTGARIEVVGLADVVAAAHVAQFERALPQASFFDATDFFDDVRAIKSAEEIANLEQTSAILRDVFDALQAEIRPGVDERDLLAEAHRLCRQFGCFDGIAMAGRPPVQGFGPGIGGVIERGDVIVVDLEWDGPSGLLARAAALLQLWARRAARCSHTGRRASRPSRRASPRWRRARRRRTSSPHATAQTRSTAGAPAMTCATRPTASASTRSSRHGCRARSATLREGMVLSLAPERRRRGIARAARRRGERRRQRARDRGRRPASDLRARRVDRARAMTSCVCGALRLLQPTCACPLSGPIPTVYSGSD